jgi:hypothetical protein
MTQDTFTDLRAIVDQIIEAHEDAERVDPAAIAAEAMAKLNEAELRYARVQEDRRHLSLGSSPVWVKVRNPASIAVQWARSEKWNR